MNENVMKNNGKAGMIFGIVFVMAALALSVLTSIY